MVLDVTTSPIVSRIQLGRTLRRLREDAKVTRETAARTLDCDVSKISRAEAGKGVPRPLEIKGLLELYRAPADVVENTLRLGKDARRRVSYRAPDWAKPYIGLEQGADAIRTFQNELVPGLMQTEPYARAVIRAYHPTKDDRETEHMVRTRVQRQQRLLGADPPQLWVILSEAVIHRTVGGPKTMQDQLTRLIKLAERRTIWLHVLPFTAGAHAAMGTSFILLDLPELDGIRIGYVEDLTSAEYLDQAPDVDWYSLAFERLLGAAMGGVETIDLLERVRQQMYVEP